MSAAPPDPTATEPRERLFFALWPPADVRARLRAAAAVLAVDEPGRLVAEDRYHLTVAFLGAVTAAQRTAVQRLGAQQRVAPVELTLDAYEYWPKPEVVVAVARELPASLARWWSALHADLGALGLALEPKRLRPHVTLARKVAVDPQLPPFAPLRWRAAEFCLTRSDTRGAESTYTVVDTWPLLDKG